MKESIKSIFTSTKGSLSSKRVFGGLGLVIIFGAYVYAVIVPVQLPECTEFLAGVCASLLGVDSVVSAVKRNDNCERVDYEDQR